MDRQIGSKLTRKLLNFLRKVKRKLYGQFKSIGNQNSEKVEQGKSGKKQKTSTSEQKKLAKRRKRKQIRLAEQKINRMTKRLYNLGFTERGFADLQHVSLYSEDAILKKMATWKMIIWHANQYNEAGARQCLDLLPQAIKGEKDSDILRQCALLQAECYERLGDIESAQQVIGHARETHPHADFNLALANLESSHSKRLDWINKALAIYGLSEISLDVSPNKTLYDCLVSNVKKEDGSKEHIEAPKVSVIMPVYNAQDIIHTSLDSILSQTWRHIEVLVVDDCSTDATISVLEEYVQKDSRVHLIKAESNGGAYVARNLALQVATGDLVTVNDADDWSHPEKIERQVLHLTENPSIMGNTSQQARMTEDLQFYRRGNAGFFIFNNMSSFMFRREPVMKALGFWDSVRFGADSEFIKRMTKIFGEESIVELPTGPLSFQRQSSGSLTGNSAFGFHGFFMGARKDYYESHIGYHARADVNDLYYHFPQVSRPFAIPEPMWPTREAKASSRRHFDIILVSDFRLEGGSNMSNIEEIIAQKQLGLRVGLIQMARYELNSNRHVIPQIRELIDGKLVQMIVYGEKVSCDLMILRYPPILQDRQRYVPDVEAEHICIIVNQPPMSDYGPNAELRYHIETANQHLKQYFGKEGTWYPIGPLVREALMQHHAEELESITLAPEDWSNIIDIESWKRSSRPLRGSKYRIGRHARDHVTKWPVDANELLTIYPDSDEYEIHVLGGAESPTKILEQLPNNWRVIQFGEVHPKAFLATLDVFVYYTHPDWVESFGRVIIEAMAVGVPAILPPTYRELFGEAAIYAEPNEVKENIERLMADDDYYKSQVDKAHAYVDKYFGYSRHALRINKFRENPDSQQTVPIERG